MFVPLLFCEAYHFCAKRKRVIPSFSSLLVLKGKNDTIPLSGNFAYMFLLYIFVA